MKIRLASDFQNGDKVKYAGGLVFTFIGYHPEDRSRSFCIDLTSKKVVLLDSNRLKIQYHEE